MMPTRSSTTDERSDDMAARKTSTRSRVTAAAKSGGRRVVGPKAIGRLEKSLDAADLALKDLRKELGRGSSTLVRDLERTIKDSRRNLTSLNKSVLRDLEKLQKAATQGTSPKKPARRAASATTAKRAA